jgi:hypothetical protein
VDASVFEKAVREIGHEYSRLGHQLGWRFLCVPARNLAPSTSIALITANPGGNEIPEEHPVASCENGSAYVVECWGTSAPGRHKLQVQIQNLFAEAASACDASPDGGLELLNSSLLAYFIPFRSRRLSELHQPQQSRVFARQLWTDLFRYIRPRLVITIDRETYRDVKSIIEDMTERTHLTRQELPTGWGQYTATIDRYKAGAETITALRLPHLSTFQLFTSDKSREHTQKIISRACEGLRTSETKAVAPHLESKLGEAFNEDHRTIAG